jgi:hypothetical protein
MTELSQYGYMCGSLQHMFPPEIKEIIMSATPRMTMMEDRV